MTHYLVYIKMFVFILITCMTNFDTREQGMRTVHLSGHAQGTTWQVTYYNTAKPVETHQIDSILLVIDSSLSLYKPYSSIVAFNKSKRGIKIDAHFKNVILKSFQIYHATEHLSDATIGPLVSAWGFGAKKSEKVPSDSLLATLKPCIGSDKIYMKGDSLIKTNPCVQLDVNGIAQGYSVDVMAGHLETMGINNYLVELGGELRIKGKKMPANQAFNVGIESPGENEFLPAPVQKIISIDNGAITTSGNYRKFYESNGRNISHIINPITGQPVNNELISVTVYADSAMTADGYDNAFLLMGLNKAMQVVESNKHLAAFFIYKKPDGSIADTASSRFQKLFVNR